MLLNQSKPYKHQTDFADSLSKVEDKDLDAYVRDLVDRYPAKARRLFSLLERELNNGRHYNLENLYK